MSKIQMKTPLVEMDGDEMTRILWQMIKDELLLPYIDLKTEYYDLGLEHRNETDDQVTVDSANATLKYGVAVKCATITPNAARMTEYNLKEMWKSPNGTIRAILDGTVFRAPILVKGIVPYVKNWTKPITIARHAYGDVYKNTEIKVPGPGKAELVFTAADGTETRELIHNFDGAGIIQGIRPLIGYNYGAGERKRVEQIYRLTLELTAGIMAAGTALCWLIPGGLIGLFTENPETITIGIMALHIISLGFILSAVSVTSSGALEALGQGMASLVISVMRYVAVIIPAAFVLSRLIGVTGVWWAFVCTESVTAMVAYVLYRKVWKRA